MDILAFGLLAQSVIGNYILAIVVLGGIGAILAIVMAVSDATIANYGDCTINMGEDLEPLTVRGGGNLLSNLFSNKIFVPSACGGQGTCGYCKVRVDEGGGPILPTEEGFLTKQEMRSNWRLSCQVKVKSDMDIYMPEEYFAIKEYKAKVQSNNNVSTFIKELILELVEPSEMKFESGKYIQLHVPKFKCEFSEFDIDEPYRDAYKPFLGLKAESKEAMIYRAYSMANEPRDNKRVMLNVRIATPPRGTKHPPGIGSSYIFNLKPGDEVEISGPYGDFLIKDTKREMVYLGGGAGMAPMRSHLFYLLKEAEVRDRQISFWYGARSVKEMFYHEEFLELEEKFDNFKYTVALSDKQPEDNWDGPEGFIHQVCDDLLLSKHPDPKEIEYYLCGPPMMIDAVNKMLLEKHKVPEDMIAYDVFG